MQERVAEVEMRVFDFGPDCKIYIGDEFAASIGDYSKDGKCEPIRKEIPFCVNNNSDTAKITIKVFRDWKGEERLVYTREANLYDGFNILSISYYGVKTERQRKPAVGRNSAPSDDSRPFV